MNIFTLHLTSMLQMAGSQWTAIIDSEPVCFYAIFDAENRLEDDATGMSVLIAGNVITCATTIAKEFTFGQEIRDHCDKVWITRETLMIDDGALSKVTIVEKP